jgi:hypothetical protein
MYPQAVPLLGLAAHRSLRVIEEAMGETERALFGQPSGPRDAGDLKRRTAVTSWSGDSLPLGTRVGEVPDPGVILGLLYEGPTSSATLPVDVFAQTLRRYALRDPKLKQRFDEHVDESGTYVPAWLSPELRRQRSQEAFDVAMKVAREQGFAQAAPLFEGVRGDFFPQAQIAIAVYELRELGDKTSALRRLNDVIQVAPRNIAARMQRARILMRETSRRVEAATDYLIVLREVSRGDGGQEAAEEVSQMAIEKLWELHAEFANKKKLEQALALANEDADRGYEAVSRYVHTHPCSWDAQVRLAGLALAKERFDAVVKLLAPIRWLFPSDPRPHFMYGQALASRDLLVPAVRALEHAASLAPNDADIERWLRFARGGREPPARDARGPRGGRAGGGALAARDARLRARGAGRARGDGAAPLAWRSVPRLRVPRHRRAREAALLGRTRGGADGGGGSARHRAALEPHRLYGRAAAPGSNGG